uniref:Uncharacterized protein n=1 Tax=Knipowitschia caucasica TaxID=637954 RepID=A0AAV2LBG6_KNICA
MTSIYGKEILPPAAPHLREPPPELRPWKDKPPNESTVHLTPHMVNAEMLKLFNNEMPRIPSSSELKNRLKKQLKKDDNNK